MSLNVENKALGGSPVGSSPAVLSLDARLARSLPLTSATQAAAGSTVAPQNTAGCQTAGHLQASGLPPDSVHSHDGNLGEALVPPPTLQQEADVPREDDALRERERDEERLRDDVRSERLPAPLTPVLLAARSDRGMNLALLAVGAPTLPAQNAQNAKTAQVTQGAHAAQAALIPTGTPITAPLSPASAAPPALPTVATSPALAAAPSAPSAAVLPSVPAGATVGATSGNAEATATTLPSPSPSPSASATATVGAAPSTAASAAVLTSSRTAAERGNALRDGQSPSAAVAGTTATQAVPSNGERGARAQPVAGQEPGASAGRELEAHLSLSQAARDADSAQTATSSNTHELQTRTTHKLAQQAQQALKLQQQAQAARVQESQIRVALPSFGVGQSVLARQIPGQQWTVHPSSMKVAEAINPATAPVDVSVVMDNAVDAADSATDEKGNRGRQQEHEHP